MFQQGHSYDKLQQLFAEKSEQLDARLRELARMKRLLNSIWDNLTLAEQHPVDTPELIRQEAECLAITKIPEGYGWFEKDPEKYICAHILTYRDADGVSQYPLGTILAERGWDSSTPKEIAYFYPAEPGACQNLWEKPAGRYVRVFHKGAYGDITGTLKVASDYIARNGLSIHGPIYEYDCVTYLAATDDDSVQMLLIPVE